MLLVRPGQSFDLTENTEMMKLLQYGEKPFKTRQRKTAIKERQLKAIEKTEHK